MSVVPWGALLVAAARMGVAPESFWRLSLAEWRLLAAGTQPAPVAMARAELEALVARFPDEGVKDGRGE